MAKGCIAYVGDECDCMECETDRDYAWKDRRKTGSERFHEVLREIGELHDTKQRDYGKPEDPFANVRASEEWGIDGWKGAMVRANDKVKRLQNYARTGSLSNEGAEDSFRDLACYALIALCLWEQEKGL